jgi:hypothetical protein
MPRHQARLSRKLVTPSVFGKDLEWKSRSCREMTIYSDTLDAIIDGLDKH